MEIDSCIVIVSEPGRVRLIEGVPVRNSVSNMRFTALIALTGLLWSISGCGSLEAPVRIYPPHDLENTTESSGEMERIDKDELFNVVLLNGDRFEARFKNEKGGVLRFYHLRWQQGPSDDLAIATERLFSCAMSDVSEVYVTKTTTTGKVLAGAGLVVLVGGLVAYGRMQGGYD